MSKKSKDKKKHKKSKVAVDIQGEARALPLLGSDQEEAPPPRFILGRPDPAYLAKKGR
jgi:hypothetical protein